MNWIPALIGNKVYRMVMLCLLIGWIPPLQADRHYNDREYASEQRRYYDDRRVRSSSRSQRSRKPPDVRSRGSSDVNLDEAISRVRRQSDGRVLSAETVRNNDRAEHRVRVITDDGRVRRYRLDARTGDLLPRRR